MEESEVRKVLSRDHEEHGQSGEQHGESGTMKVRPNDCVCICFRL